MYEFDNVMRIFRTEDPLFIQVVPSNGIGFIGTSEKEPVGEGEPLPKREFSLS